MSAPDVDASFIAAALPAFVSEALEQVGSAEQLLLQLEAAPDDHELLDALFRCAHTVKGSAGIFGLEAVVAFTHHVETLLDRLREGAIPLTPALSTLLLRCNDAIRTLVECAAPGTTAVTPDAARLQVLIDALQVAGGGASPVAPASAEVPHRPAPGHRRWSIAARFGGDTFRSGMDPIAVLGYLGQMGQLVAMRCDLAAVPVLESLDPEHCYLGFSFEFDSAASREDIEGAFSFVQDDLVLSLTEMTPDCDTAATAPPPRVAADKPAAARDAASAPAEDQRFIRVQADRLDAVINLLGELVTADAGAALLARLTGQEALIEAHLQIGRLIEEIRNGTLQLRMVAIGETFARFRRVVRDTASELGKNVAFEIVGGETELDKSVVERIADPLMHLVRNALDHGLEPADERSAAGKPPQGKLTLSARHESGSILISIVDDGRGIDREQVLARAWERGLVERGVTPPDAEIVNLIFEPGFSTAEKVTNLSGRGVGMDVVRRNIEALRGSVTVESEHGAGSRIEIRLPLTLAIIDGFLVAVGTSKFIFPLESVVEVIETGPAFASMDPHGRSLVALRGQSLPVVSLRRLYEIDAPVPDRTSVVVIKAGAHLYGVLVDQLLGQHQTVIKPLGRMFQSLRGMSGSSILGSGEVALIFDVNSLSQLAIAPPVRRALH